MLWDELPLQHETRQRPQFRGIVSSRESETGFISGRVISLSLAGYLSVDACWASFLGFGFADGSRFDPKRLSSQAHKHLCFFFWATF